MKKQFTAAILAIALAAGLTACGSKESSVIKVAATSVPHAEILEAAKPILKEKGYDLQVTEFQDYVQPNEARALLLLADNGLITLKEGAGIEATVLDIADNPHNIKFTELEAAQISRVLPEVSFAVLNGNYALEAGLNAAKDALAIETSDSEAAKTYVNVIVVKEGNEKNEGVKALVEVLKSDEIKKFIHEKYEGSVVPF